MPLCSLLKCVAADIVQSQIGLVSLLAARAAGAAPIVITDLSAERLAFAQKIVPTVRTVQIQKGLDPEQQAVEIKKAAGCELQVVLECTGVESSVQTAIFSVKKNSMVFIIGVGKVGQSGTLPLPPLQAYGWLAELHELAFHAYERQRSYC